MKFETEEALIVQKNKIAAEEFIRSLARFLPDVKCRFLKPKIKSLPKKIILTRLMHKFKST